MTSEQGLSSPFLISELFSHVMLRLFGLFISDIMPSLRLVRCSNMLRPASIYDLQLDHCEFDMFR